MLLGVLGASKWVAMNKAAINDEEPDVFEDIERREMTLSTGINYDFYESKQSGGQTLRKYSRVRIGQILPESSVSAWISRLGFKLASPNEQII